MATPETMQLPTLGEQGEPCGGCGSPLAADQRYCLNCGLRRAGPRVDYRDHLVASGGEAAPPEPPATAAASAPPAEPSKPERDYAPLAAVGGIAVLGLMLLVGVLIGKGNNTTPVAAPAPIVKIPAGSAATSAEGEESAKSTTASSGKGSKKSDKADTGAKTVEGGLTGEAARNSDATVQATTDDLESLNGTSGDSYQDAIKKLPDKIATPGAPPPIDTTKAPGGGGAAETIK